MTVTENPFRRVVKTVLPLIFLLAGVGACSAAAFQSSTIETKIARARGGEVIALPAETAGVLTISGGVYRPAITIDASNANLAGIVFRNVDGVIVKGGTIVGPGGRSYGISIQSARNIRVENMMITAAHRGVVVSGSQDISLVGLNLTGLISDGINVALSRRVLIERNRCRDFRPSIATYDAGGKLIKDGDHPDCIQAWSRPSTLPTADITVVGNDIDGMMQGIFFGNHIRNGIDDGGFDRITIRDNHIRVGYPNALVLSNVRVATIKNNSISTVAGSRLANRADRLVQASMNVSGTEITSCGNTIEQVDSRPRPSIGTTHCK